MKLCLHLCCGLCGAYCVPQLQQKKIDLVTYFHRDNIHPYQECLRREEGAKTLSYIDQFPLIIQEGYDLEGFLQDMAFHEEERCARCYERRLLATAQVAQQENCTAFTTTLLYSKYQNHNLIRSIGESIARETGVDFYYEDFRLGWKEGIERSKQLGLYRQPYCGCIYSEKERYFKIKK